MPQINWVHERLMTWSVWRVSGGGSHTGYSCPLGNLDQRVGRSSDVRPGLHSMLQFGDMDVLLTDRAVAALPLEFRRAVEMVYCYDGGMDLAAQKLRVSRSTLHNRVCNSHVRIADWFDQRKKFEISSKTILRLAHGLP